MEFTIELGKDYTSETGGVIDITWQGGFDIGTAGVTLELVRPSDKYPYPFAVAMLSHGASQSVGLSITKAQSQIFDTGSYQWELQVTLTDGSVAPAPVSGVFFVN